MKAFIALILIFIIIFNNALIIQESSDDVKSIALKYLNERFGNANYEIVRTEELKDYYLISASEGKNLYILKIDSQSRKVEELEARNLNLNFEISRKETEMTIKCLGSQGEGIEINLFKNSSISFSYYTSPNEKLEELDLVLTKISLIEIIDFSGDKIIEPKEILNVFDTSKLQANFKSKSFNLSNGKTLEIEASYEYNLSNGAKMILSLIVIPSSKIVANETKEIDKKEYKTYLRFSLENYKKSSQESSLLLKLEFNKDIINETNLGYMLATRNKMGVLLDTENAQDNVFFEANNFYVNLQITNGKTVQILGIGYSWFSVKKVINIFNNIFTILLSTLVFILIILFLLIRNRRINKEIKKYE